MFFYGIEGVFFGFGVKIVIFRKVVGKFFIRFVLNMIFEVVGE